MIPQLDIEGLDDIIVWVDSRERTPKEKIELLKHIKEHKKNKRRQKYKENSVAA